MRLPGINGLDFQQDLANAGSDQRNHSEDPSRPRDAEMQADSLAELVRMAADLRLAPGKK